MKKKKLIISLVLKLGVAILIFIAIIIDLVKVKEIHNLKYFTQLSNIFAAIVALIYVVYSKEFNNALRSSLSSLMEQSLVVQNNAHYSEDSNVNPVNNHPFKQVLLRLLSLITYPFKEML